MFAELKNQWELSGQEKTEKLAYMKKVHDKLMEIKDAGNLLQESIVQKIEIDQKGIYIVLNQEYGEMKLYINENDYEEVPISVLCFGDYEVEETGMVCKILQFYKDENLTIFDVGANIGWYTLNILKRFPQMEVYSFEPSPVTYQRLLCNLEANNGKVQNAFNIGLYKESGELEFYFDREGSGASSLVNLRDKASVEKISVEMRRMDEWASEHNVDKVDFIKCDVEGSELFVYEGGRALIERSKPIIFSEMLRKWTAKFNYTPNDIILFMKELGYGCYVINNGRLKECKKVDQTTVETNYFFLHREKHALIVKELAG